MRVTYTNEFRCSANHLWRFLDEPELQKRWMKGVLDNQPTSEGPPGVGSTFRMKIQEGRKAADYDGKITAYDRPRHLAVDLSGGNFPAGMVVHVDYRLSEENGSTSLDYVAEMTSCSRMPWYMRLLMPLGKVFMKLQLRSFMKTLKRLAESPEFS
jgi:uncharacterized protein YndB with AHSA1/START domain